MSIRWHRWDLGARLLESHIAQDSVRSSFLLCAMQARLGHHVHVSESMLLATCSERTQGRCPLGKGDSLALTCAMQARLEEQVHDLTCQICMEDVMADKRMSCGHRMCRKCYVQLASPTCPFCMQLFSQDALWLETLLTEAEHALL